MNDILADLRGIWSAPTPLIRHPDDHRMLLKLEGGGTNPGHKMRSAAYLVACAIAEGMDVRKAAERSSGSMAMGISGAVHRAGGVSRFVSVGPPPPPVCAFVEARGGTFEVVSSNRERVARLEDLVAEGYWTPDQHNNPRVI